MSENIERYLDLTGLTQYDSNIKTVIQKDITSAWDGSSHSYVVGDYVVYKGILYQCKTAHTSSSTFDATKWNQVKLIDNVLYDYISKNIADAFIANTSYAVGSYVTYKGQLYRCTSASTAGWDSSKWTAIQVMEQVQTDITSKINTSVTSNIADGYNSSSAYSIGDFVTRNGQLYKCNTAIPTGGEAWNSSHWTAVQAMDEVGIVAAPQAKNTVLAGPDGSTGHTDDAIPEFRALVADDIPDLSTTYQTKLTTQTAYTAVGSSTKIPVITTNTLGQVTALSTADVVSANNGKLTINGATPTSGTAPKIEFNANQSDDTTGTIDKTFVGLGNVANYAQSDIYKSEESGYAAVYYFTAGGANDLYTDLLGQIRTQAAHFRGTWSTWTDVPTSATDYPEDADGNKTPTANDYMIVTDASDYTGDTLEGTWRFTYTGTWSTDGKSGWLPAYQIENVPLSFKTINNTSIIGTGNITTPDHYQAPTYTSSTNALQLGTGNGGSSNMYVPYANGTTQAGVVSTVAQTFGGVKTFSSAPKFDSGASYKQGSNSTYATVVGNGSASAATTITLPSDSGTLVIEDDLPVVEFNENPYTGTVTTIKGMKVGTDQYNFYVPDSIAAATTEVLGSVKLGTASAGTATKTYPVGFNGSQQMYVDVPWTDTATAVDNILDGSNSGTAITYKPYTSQQSKLSFDTSASNPSRTDRLNLNGKLYATDLYVDSGDSSHTPTQVVSLAKAQTITGQKTFDSAIKIYQSTVSSTKKYATIQGDSTATGDIILTLPKISGTLALDGDIAVKSVTDGIWDLAISSNRALTVSPYDSSSAGHFDNSNTAPTSTATRLNWNGILYVPQLNIATNGGLLFYDGTNNGYKNAIITGAQTRLQYKQTTGTAKDIAFTSDIPYVSMAYDTHANTAAAGQPSTAYNETTWNYRQEGTSGDPLTVKFQSIKESEIAALF